MNSRVILYCVDVMMCLCVSVNEIATKFTAHYDAIEETLKSDTVGLVTLDEMMAKQKDVIAKRQVIRIVRPTWDCRESQLAHKWIDESRRQMKEADSQQKGVDDQKVFNPRLWIYSVHRDAFCPSISKRWTRRRRTRRAKMGMTAARIARERRAVGNRVPNHRISRRQR